MDVQHPDIDETSASPDADADAPILVVPLLLADADLPTAPQLAESVGRYCHDRTVLARRGLAPRCA